MSDRSKVIENPDNTPSPRREDRAQELEEWTEEQGRRNAAEESIELTDEHWEVVHCLRENYLENPPDNGREVGDMLAERFADRGGRQYLRKLFPLGPVGQGMRIAGLEVPPYTEDDGFGTSS